MSMSGRGHHDAKMTTYLTSGELLALDHTLLEMRRVYGVKIDRSRFVREAIAAASARAIAARIKDEAPAVVEIAEPKGRPRRSRDEIPACGSESAYQRHKRLGEAADRACLDAHAAHESERVAGLKPSPTLVRFGDERVAS